MVDPHEALHILLELTRQLTEQRPLSEALKLVTDAALCLVPGDHASIRVLDRSRTELLSGARSGIGLGKRPVRHVPGLGIAGWVVDRGEVVRIDDARADERFVLKPNQGFRICSMLAVPLWSAGEVIGVLAATSETAGAFTPEHEALASLLANCAVPPIEKARLARLAVTDAQTLAFNHSYLLPGLREQMRRHRGMASSLSVLLIDLDHFKAVNDSYGHAAGDEVLREFAGRLRTATRDNDVLVRRGGDEFVLIMPGTDRESARFVAERLRRAMEGAPVRLGDGREIVQTVSVGTATWNGKEAPEELEKRADEAMYRAKDAGRNQVVCCEDASRSSPDATTQPTATAPREDTVHEEEDQQA